MTEVRWTEQAVDDLRAIREFISRDSPRYGRLVAERLFDAVREIIIGEYRIVYRLTGEAAVLLTVFRSSRLFPTVLG